jgi:DNA-directed RNA polymerase subunit alpha
LVTAANLELNSEVELVNPEAELATLTAKNAELDIEVTVERGLGYSAVEARKSEKLAVGVIGVDAFFSPVVKVTYTTENMRVADRTDYNRLRLEIETDGTISPSAALHKTANVLKDHFDKVVAVEVKEFEVPKEETGKKKTTRTKKS